MEELVKGPMAGAMDSAKARRKQWADERAGAGHAALVRQLGKTMDSSKSAVLREDIGKACHRFMERRYLSGAFPLVMADGITVTVDDVLLEECRARLIGGHSAWHGRQLHDPAEPEYMGGKITAKLYTDGLPGVHSFAHGATVWRMLLSEGRWLAEYLACTDKDSRHSWIGASADLVDLPDGEGRIKAQLKSGDGARWKQARAQYNEPIDPDIPMEVVDRYTGIEPIDGDWAQLYLDSKGPKGALYLDKGNWAVFDDALGRYTEGRENYPVRDQLLGMLKEAATVRPKLRPWLLGATPNQKVFDLVKVGADRASDADFDGDPLLLNTPAGPLDLHNGGAVLRRGMRGDMLRKTLRVQPMEGDWSAWQEAILNITVDEHGNYDWDRFDFMLDMLAQALAGVHQKRFPIIWGAPNTGKTTLVEALAWILGPYAGTIGKEAIVSNAKHRAQVDGQTLEKALNGVLGKRLVTCPEFSEEDRFNTASIKMLTGGDRLRSRALFKNVNEGYFHGLLMSVTNVVPSMATFDDALRQRIILFNPQKPYMLPNGALVDRAEAHVGRADIGAVLRAQGGALLWELIGRINRHAPDGWRHVHAPNSVLYSIANVSSDDPLDHYVRARLASTVKGAGVRAGLTVATIKEDFVAWAMEAGMAVELPSPQILGKKLASHGLVKAKTGQLVGIGQNTYRIGAQDKIQAGPEMGATVYLARLSTG
jgi:hypothetical protein